MRAATGDPGRNSDEGARGPSADTRRASRRRRRKRRRRSADAWAWPAPARTTLVKKTRGAGSQAGPQSGLRAGPTPLEPPLKRWRGARHIWVDMQHACLPSSMPAYTAIEQSIKVFCLSGVFGVPAYIEPSG